MAIKAPTSPQMFHSGFHLRMLAAHQLWSSKQFIKSHLCHRLSYFLCDLLPSFVYRYIYIYYIHNSLFCLHLCFRQTIFLGELEDMIHMMPSADFKSVAAWRLWRLIGGRWFGNVRDVAVKT